MGLRGGQRWYLRCLMLWQPLHAFYLPGSNPVSYELGALIPVTAEKMLSYTTQIPFNYYHFNFCKADEVYTASVNLGQILKGDVIENTPYEIFMGLDEECKILCEKNYTSDDVSKLRTLIQEKYIINLSVDDLPMALMTQQKTPASLEGAAPNLVVGYPIGAQRDGKYHLVNHLNIRLKYHSVENGRRVVGVDVAPASELYSKDNDKLVCSKSSGPLSFTDSTEELHVIYSYSVAFEESSTAWATRWDPYLTTNKDEEAIHWFSILDGLVVVSLLGILGVIVLMRTVLKDIARYNALDDIEEAEEEAGWKLLHGDVFRRPKYSRFLAALAGSGVQLLIMVVLTTLFSLFGLISPSNRGALLESCLLLFAFMGGPAGYIAAVFNRTMGVDEQSTVRSLAVTAFTALLYPGIVFAVFFILNFILWTKSSSGAVPFGTMFLLLFLWFGVAVPLTVAGAYMGYRKGPVEIPVRVNRLPRQIKKVSWIAHPNTFALAAGMIPLSVAVGEINSIVSSLVYHNFYYLFGFLALVIVLTLMAAALVAVIATYSSLVQENYNWWWKSFIAAGSSSIYLMIFSMIQFMSLEITQLASVIIYFGYAFILCFTVGVLLGSVGFLVSFFFVRSIYCSIKVD